MAGIHFWGFKVQGPKFMASKISMATVTKFPMQMQRLVQDSRCGVSQTWTVAKSPIEQAVWRTLSPSSFLALASTP